MKTILLLRHAKSAWSDPRLDDHERPLNRRGEQAAKAMAEHIVHHEPRPGLIRRRTQSAHDPGVDDAGVVRFGWPRVAARARLEPGRADTIGQ